ncbi:MAG: type IV pilus assembly protein PilM [Nitrospinae bacterium]|nr:type IV pilus assembly protein PilM [Nitrospinota bacterium]MBL7021227.1 type IV pilus assembly protein PilM [Nitrospinaceae bacterium]
MKLKSPTLSLAKSEKSIGLDIGFHDIKVVELIRNDQGFQVTKFAIREIPSEILQQKDRTGLLGDMIKDMLSDAKIKGSSIYISVTGHNVIIRNASLPKMPPEELIEAAKWNAKEEVLFDLDKAVVDNYVMGETNKDGATLLDLLSVIVRGDVLDFIISIVKSAGLRPKGVTVVPIALWDYDNAVNPQKPEVVTSYVDMGAERTRIYFVCDGRILFSREIPNGGKNLTACLVGEYELENGKTAIIDEVRAEQIKKIFGYPAEDSDGKTEEGVPLKLIRERLEPILIKQATEMDRSIEYFKNQYRKDSVDRLILSGGGVGLRGLYQFLKETLDLEIDRCNVFMQASVQDDSISKEDMKLYGPSLTVAAGLALGQCDKINVLPEKYRPSLKKTLIKLAPLAAVLVLFVALYGYSSTLRSEVSSKYQLLSDQKVELTNLQLQVPKLQEPIQELKSLNESKKALNEEKSQLPGSSTFPFNFELVFSELSLLVSNDTSLSQITYAAKGSDEAQAENADLTQNRERIKINGEIFGAGLKVQSSLQKLLQDLKNSPVFSDIKLIKSSPLPKGQYNSPGIMFQLYVFPAPDNSA